MDTQLRWVSYEKVTEFHWKCKQEVINGLYTKKFHDLISPIASESLSSIKMTETGQTRGCQSKEAMWADRKEKGKMGS